MLVNTVIPSLNWIRSNLASSGPSREAQRRGGDQSEREGPDGWRAPFGGTVTGGLSCSR
jgi:hypothetical protein